MIELLLHAGADPYLKGSHGRGLHHDAAVQGNEDLQKMVSCRDGYDYDEPIDCFYFPPGGVCIDPKGKRYIRSGDILHMAASNASSDAIS